MLSFKALRARLVWLLGLCAAAGIAANYKFNYGPRFSAASSPHGSEAPPGSATPQEKQLSPEAQTVPEKQPSPEAQTAAVPAAVAAAAAAVTAAAAALVPCDGGGCSAALQDMRLANAQLHAALQGVGATDEKNSAPGSVGLLRGAVKAKVQVEEAPATAAAEDVGVAAAAGKDWSAPPTQVEGPAGAAVGVPGGRSARLPTLIIYAAVDDGEEGSWDRRDNLRFFLRHALLDHSEYQFLIVINGCNHMDVAKYVMARNVHVLVRENVCFDAGAWLAGLDYMAEVQERVGRPPFKRYVFFNNSVRGPFLPPWLRGDSSGDGGGGGGNVNGNSVAGSRRLHGDTPGGGSGVGSSSSGGSGLAALGGGGGGTTRHLQSGSGSEVDTVGGGVNAVADIADRGEGGDSGGDGGGGSSAPRFDWVAAFTSPLNKRVKLVGTSVNCNGLGSDDGGGGGGGEGEDAAPPSPPLRTLHLQSMALATDDEGMACCFRPTLESPECTAEWGIGEVIWYREVEFTTRMLAAGHAVTALLAMWRGVEISVANREEVLQRCARAHTQENVFDVFYAGNYGPGIDVHPFEVMFFKTNRGVQELQLQAYTEWQDPGFFTQEARHAFVAQRRVCPPPPPLPKRRLRPRGSQRDDAHLF